MMINLNQASFLKESLHGEAEGEHSDVVEGILEADHRALPPYEDLPIGTISGTQGKQKLLSQTMESHQEDMSNLFLYQQINDLQNLSENLTQLERGPDDSVLPDHQGKISLLDLDVSERGRLLPKPTRWQCPQMAPLIMWFKNQLTLLGIFLGTRHQTYLIRTLQIRQMKNGKQLLKAVISTRDVREMKKKMQP